MSGYYCYMFFLLLLNKKNLKADKIIPSVVLLSHLIIGTIYHNCSFFNLIK